MTSGYISDAYRAVYAAHDEMVAVTGPLTGALEMVGTAERLMDTAGRTPLTAASFGAVGALRKSVEQAISDAVRAQEKMLGVLQAMRA